MPSGTNFDIVFHILEITVFGAMLHSLKRAHTSIGFIFSSFKNYSVTGGLVDAGKQGTSHDRRSTGSDGFHYIAGITYPTIGNDRYSGTFQRFGDVVNRRQLRHANAGDDTCSTNRTRTYADLDGVYIQFARSYAASAVAMLPMTRSISGNLFLSSLATLMTFWE